METPWGAPLHRAGIVGGPVPAPKVSVRAKRLETSECTSPTGDVRRRRRDQAPDASRAGSNAAGAAVASCVSERASSAASAGAHPIP